MADFTKIALSGINNANKAIANTSNNIANSETTGFKSQNITFNQMVVKSGTKSTGVGVDGGTVNVNFTNGTMVATGNELHQAISGDGFLVVKNSNGETSYTRSGAFDFDKNGYLVDLNGARVQGFSSGDNSISDIKLNTTPLPPIVTDTGALDINFGSDLASAGDKLETSIQVFDSLGDSHRVTIKFDNYTFDPTTNEATWDISVEQNGIAVPLAPNTMTFNNSGQLVKGSGAITTDGKFNIDLSGTTPPLPGITNVEVDMSDSRGYAGDSSINSQESNGRSYSEYNGYKVESDGNIVFSYAGGATKAISQIALANIQNPEGLITENEGYYSRGIDAGTASYGIAGGNGFGNLYSGYLEGSNVDITSELVELISGQKQFQSNSKVLGVAKDLNNALLQAI